EDPLAISAHVEERAPEDVAGLVEGDLDAVGDVDANVEPESFQSPHRGLGIGGGIQRQCRLVLAIPTPVRVARFLFLEVPAVGEEMARAGDGLGGAEKGQESNERDTATSAMSAKVRRGISSRPMIFRRVTVYLLNRPHAARTLEAIDGAEAKLENLPEPLVRERSRRGGAVLRVDFS